MVYGTKDIQGVWEVVKRGVFVLGHRWGAGWSMHRVCMVYKTRPEQGRECFCSFQFLVSSSKQGVITVILRWGYLSEMKGGHHLDFQLPTKTKGFSSFLCAVVFGLWERWVERKESHPHELDSSPLFECFFFFKSLTPVPFFPFLFFTLYSCRAFFFCIWERPDYENKSQTPFFMVTPLVMVFLFLSIGKWRIPR